MTTRASFPSVLLLVVGLGLSGCSDSATGNTRDPLTVEEAATLLEMLYIIGFIEPFDMIPEPDGPFDGTVDVVVDCLEGHVGIEIDYEGTYNPDTEDGVVEAGGVLDFDGCLLGAEDFPITLDGDPAVDVEWDITIDGGVGVYTLDFDGGIEFETDDDRSGRCDVNITLSADEESEEFDLELTGSMCGASASEIEAVLETL